ncbi:hypothetical protein Pcinc_044102 [Petrolisthes cinctipes]|uniref:Uncharacterized protein n=1 Tax=Petrolisthes cinctipes TaxID=88211 RepID=A0AAE1BHS3_PETCI|nr:hypothetical protein Pcinc_044102 [Petrolisthes cinctipes]
MVPPAPPRPATPRGSTRRSPRLPGLAAILEGRPCLPTLSSLAATRTARQQAAGRGAANRLAAHHEDTSTLDLARAAATIPPYSSHTHRFRYYPPTALV